MSKKRTKLQKKQAKTRVKETLVTIADKQPVKKVFANELDRFIISDLKRTIIYTVLIIAVLLVIFVYTKTS